MGTNKLSMKIWALAAFAWATSCCDAPAVRREPLPESDPTGVSAQNAAALSESQGQTGASSAPKVADANGKFVEAVTVDSVPLKLNGKGLCEWGWIGVDLYNAAFYIQEPTRDAAKILATPQPAIIHLAFVRSLSKDQLDEAFTAAVAANVKDPSIHAGALKQLRETLSDVNDGDSLNFTVEPGERLVVHKNDKLAGSVDDAAFAWLFVELYIGAKPPTASLKAGLLGMPG